MRPNELVSHVSGTESNKIPGFTRYVGTTCLLASPLRNCTNEIHSRANELLLSLTLNLTSFSISYPPPFPAARLSIQELLRLSYIPGTVLGLGVQP